MNKQLVKGVSGALVFTMVGLMGCASQTMIKSIPSGAKVYIDQEYRGDTPYQYSDTKIVGSRTYVTLKKDDYQDLNASFQRTEEFDPAACCGGVLVTVPFLWIMKYKPERTYEMIPLKGAQNPPVDSPMTE